MTQQWSQRRNGMRIDWDVPIEMDDDIVLRCDVYRPPDDGEYPVLITYGPYGKYLHFADGYENSWEQMIERNPDVAAGSSNEFQNWEVPDPEKWVPDGYAVVRVDSRGAGRSPGRLDPWSDRETRDFAGCIEWAGEQPWSNGRVGINGISYYAMNQWQVASLQPDSLVAMCAWEGAADWYRELAYHGGIYCRFAEEWFENQVKSVQHGVGRGGYRGRMNGELVAGPDTIPRERREANRVDYEEVLRSNDIATDEYWTSRRPNWSKVSVPFLSAANWGGQGLHPRGNFEAYREAASDQKWLEVHGGAHWTEFYTDYGISLQKEFFDHFLKCEDNGWADRPNVLLQIREPGEGFVERTEADWPIPRTDWTEYHLDAQELELSREPQSESASVTYEALGNGVTFLSSPLAASIEITGPIGATLSVSSETEDADLFVVVRVFHPDMEEVVFQGALDPHTPIAQGWLRASHRKLDPGRSKPYRPYHTHDERQPLTPGEIYELAIEVWPTSIVAPEGARIGISIRGNDYEYPGDVNTELEHMEGTFSGVGPFRHDVAHDRPPETFDAAVTIHTGTDHPSTVLLPVVPESD